MTRNKSKEKIVFFILAIILLLFILGTMFIKIWLIKGSSPIYPGNAQPVSISIQRGTSTKGIGEILKSEGIIADSLLFRVKSRIGGYSGKYQAGEYSLSPSMSMDEIMDLLLTGRVNTTRFTIPEGYDLRRTAHILETNGLIDKNIFIDEIIRGDFDYWFIKNLKNDENRLEGFLFPETYEVYSNISEHELIDKMLSQFNVVFTEKHKKRMDELGKDINEIIILASIIEREAVVPEDRPVISGVFQNRLKIGMPLQSCATIQYILGEQKPVLSTADTRIESPYNTYIYTGLPPTPICSPGIDSINAALWPEASEYLYFLAKGDGSHVFSKTFEEHKKNKAKYIN